MESPLLDVSIRGKKVQYKNGYELWLMNFDCSSQRLKFLSTHSYDSKGKAVKQLDEYDGGFDWGDVIPDSVGEFLLKKVCEKYN